MSLLEDVFLQDEADEAQELERVIEGDEIEERVRSDSDNNSEREDEAEEEKRRVDPSSTKTRRVTKNPRFILNPARLTGPRGIQVIPDHFKDFKFKGKGYEKEDLDLVLKKLEHWAYRLYPKFKYEDCLKKIETLGKKRPVMVHLHKIRTDQYITEETVTQKDSSKEEEEEKEPEDEFDKLLQQQIELARSTPAPGSVKKHMDTDRENSALMTPVASSLSTINNEQREKMLRNRKLAEERRLARLKSVNNVINNKQVMDTSKTDNGNGNTDENNIDDNKSEKENGYTEETNINSIKRINRSNVIESSDDEAAITTINTSITVDIHKSNLNEKSNEDNSNNILRMDTDSDTDLQNDNGKANTLNNYVNNEIETRKESKVNDNDDNEMQNSDVKENNDKTQNNDTVGSKKYEENDIDHDLNKADTTVNNKYNESSNVEISKEKSESNDKVKNINNEIVIDSELLQKEIVNEELMDVNFDDEY